jgi:hypothetical protein
VVVSVKDGRGIDVDVLGQLGVDIARGKGLKFISSDGSKTDAQVMANPALPASLAVDDNYIRDLVSSQVFDNIEPGAGLSTYAVEDGGMQVNVLTRYGVGFDLTMGDDGALSAALIKGGGLEFAWSTDNVGGVTDYTGTGAYGIKLDTDWLDAYLAGAGRGSSYNAGEGLVLEDAMLAVNHGAGLTVDINDYLSVNVEPGGGLAFGPLGDGMPLKVSEAWLSAKISELGGGSRWFSGEGSPETFAPAEAKPGDWYIDSSTGTYYELV